MKEKVIVFICVQLLMTQAQPIFGPPMAPLGGLGGPMGFSLDTLGSASGYAGGGGVPLLTPMELNAIMEAQSSGAGFKSAFTPGSEPQGYSGFSSEPSDGGFMANFDEGFGGHGDSGASEFYEPPSHGEPFPSSEGPDESKGGPEPNGRDNRGAYHKDMGPDGPPPMEEPKERPRPSRGQAYRGGREPPRQQGRYREEDRDEPNYGPSGTRPNAYREHASEAGPYGPGGPSEGPEGPDGPDGPEPYSGGLSGGEPPFRDDGPPENFRDHMGDRDYAGPEPGPNSYEPKEASGSHPPHGKQRYHPDDGPRPNHGYSSGQDDDGRPAQPSAYRPQGGSGGEPSSGYYPGRGGENPFESNYRKSVAPQSGSSHGAQRNPDYSGYKVITG